MSVVLRKVLHNDTKKLLQRQSSLVLCEEHTLKVSAWTPLAGRFGMITPKPLLHHPTVRRASVTIVTHWAGFSVILNRGGSPRTNTGPLCVWNNQRKNEKVLWRRLQMFPPTAILLINSVNWSSSSMCSRVEPILVLRGRLSQAGSTAILAAYAFEKAVLILSFTVLKCSSAGSCLRICNHN